MGSSVSAFYGIWNSDIQIQSLGPKISIAIWSFPDWMYWRVHSNILKRKNNPAGPSATLFLTQHLRNVRNVIIVVVLPAFEDCAGCGGRISKGQHIAMPLEDQPWAHYHCAGVIARDIELARRRLACVLQRHDPGASALGGGVGGTFLPESYGHLGVYVHF